MSTALCRVVPLDVSRVVPTELIQARSLQRRFNGALFDLGLNEELPAGWVIPVCSGWYFAPFNHRQADRLVSALERIGGLIENNRRTAHHGGHVVPGTGQLSFPFGEAS